MDKLRLYFASGWLFFLPYLAVYLAFWIMDGAVKTALCIYWTLHLFHFVSLLAVFWRTGLPHRSVLLFFGGVWLLFLIPGAYLEFPSDNWSHQEWIFFWNTAEYFSEETSYAKYKTATFFAASWLEWLPMSWRFAGFSFYSAILATLLIYQVWRFLRSIGLSRFSGGLASVSAMLFMGAPIQFGFYYAFSSSVPASIGIFAGLKAFTEAVSSPGRKRQWTKYAALYGAFILVTFNHFQGTGMLILGCLAVLAWNLQRRMGTSRSFALLGCIVIAGLAAGWGLVAHSEPGSRIWDALAPLRQDGWLTEWGAIPFWRFDGLRGEGPATKFLELVTWPGLLNLAAAAWLLWRGHVLGWITLAPVFAILYPVSATAIAWFHTKGTNLINIITYHRYLLMILPMAALILVIQDGIRHWLQTAEGKPGRLAVATWTCIALLVLALSGVFEHRYWFGKWRNFSEYPLPTSRLAFLAPLGDWFPNRAEFRKAAPFVIADPLTFTYLNSHFGVKTVTRDTFRLAVNDRINLGNGQIDRLSSAVAETEDYSEPVCVLVLNRDPALPLYFSWTGQMSRHWPSFCIGETMQFDPGTLEWCEANLTRESGWQAFDAPPWYRVFFRPASEEDAPTP